MMEVLESGVRPEEGATSVTRAINECIGYGEDANLVWGICCEMRFAGRVQSGERACSNGLWNAGWIGWEVGGWMV